MGTPEEKDIDTTITSDKLKFHLDGCDAYTCVTSSQSPSVHVYYALRAQLERSSMSWLQEFVSLGGLDGLLDALCQMTGTAFTSFSDAILQIDCISCIRAILNTSVGINHLLQSTDAANKLITGLRIGNTLPKKQILEMAAALCAHSLLGYKCVMAGLDYVKRDTNQYHRLSIVVNELKSAETVPHKTAVMTFLNTLITCNPDLSQRCQIRNEMIGLTLLDIINFLQREETDDDLQIQLQVFHDRKHLDEEALSKSESDLSSPAELVDLLQSKTFGTSRMASLVNVLQDLVVIETLDKEEREHLWNEVEQQVHHLVHACHKKVNELSSFSSKNIHDLLSEEAQLAQHLVNQVSGDLATEPVPTQKDQSLYDNLDDIAKQTLGQKLRLKASEPDLLGDLNNLNALSPPPTTESDIEKVVVDRTSLPALNLQPSWTAFPSTQAQMERPIINVCIRKNSWEGKSYQHGSKIEKFDTSFQPFPSCPMRNLKWIVVQKEVLESSSGSIWEPRDIFFRLEPDYNHLEQLFAETHLLSVNEEVPLLDGETRLRINLFLNRLEVEPDQLVRNLIDKEAPGLTLPLLKYLKDILPCHDEVSMLKQYNGSLLDIGMAEQFLLHLADIPDYHTLLLGHQVRVEFSANMARVKKALKTMALACTFILDSADLRDLLQLVLKLGNFLNQGQFNGNASGLHLSSLKRLEAVKSTKPNHSLLHEIAAVAEDNDERILRVFSEIPRLDEAARCSLEEIRKDVAAINTQLKQFTSQLMSADPTIAEIFQTFLENVKTDFREVQQLTEELRELCNHVVEYLGESATSFNLQTCLQQILSFLKDLRRASHENTLFKRQRVQARRRSDQFKAKLKTKRLALEFGKEARASSSMLEERKRILEHILTELHLGNFHPIIRSELPTPEQEETGVDEAYLTRGNKEHGTCSTQEANARENGSSQKAKGEMSMERHNRPLELSHISIIGSPMINRPTSEVFDDELFPLTIKETITEKIITSSASDLLDGQLPCHAPKLQHQRIGQLQRSRGRLSTPTKRVSQQTQHHRSRSDLTDSICHSNNKWLKYAEMRLCENQAQAGQGAPLALPESSLTLATLNLEDAWLQQRRTEHVMPLYSGPVVYVPQGTANRGKERKGDRKSSIGTFFSKISRAVLRPRNTAMNVEHKIISKPPLVQETKRGRSSSQSEDENKENVGSVNVENRKPMLKRTSKLCTNKMVA